MKYTKFLLVTLYLATSAAYASGNTVVSPDGMTSTTTYSVGAEIGSNARYCKAANNNTVIECKVGAQTTKAVCQGGHWNAVEAGFSCDK